MFGESVEVTREAVEKYALFFNWHCAAEKLLPPQQKARFIRELRTEVMALTCGCHPMYLQKAAARVWGRLYASV